MNAVRRLAALVKRGILFEVALYRSTARLAARRPAVPAGATPYSYVGAVVVLLWAFVIGSAVELVALHLILPWEAVRLAADVLGIWGLIWMLGFAASMHVHPHLVTDTGLLVRNGHGPGLEVPWDDVVAVRSRERSLDSGRARQYADGVLSIVVGSRTNVELTLARPVETTVRGEKVAATELHLFADDPRALSREIRSRTGQSVK